MSIFFIWCFLKMAFIYVGLCKGAKLYFFTDIWLIFVIDICDWFFFKTDICDWYFNWYMWMIFIILLIYLTDIWPIFLSDFCEWCFRRWSMCQRSWRGCLIKGQPTTCMTQSDRVPAVPWQGAKATSWRWRGTSTSRKTVSPQRASQKLPW